MVRIPPASLPSSYKSRHARVIQEASASSLTTADWAVNPVVQAIQTMKLEKAIQLTEALYTHSDIAALYKAGDDMSRHQTKHDLAHAQEVTSLAIKLASMLVERNPDLLDSLTQHVIIPMSAFLHDIGRAKNVDRHAEAGAVWSREFLSQRLTLPGDEDEERLSEEVVDRICRIIASHRSSTVLKNDFDDPAWAIVVIADKCVGDENRVRPKRALILRLLTWFKPESIKKLKNFEHDRANFAIKQVDLTVDKKELVLQIRMDRRVCEPAHIFRLYGARFWACAKAAKFLDYRFRLEFNGERYAFSKKEQTWLPVPKISVC